MLVEVPFSKLEKMLFSVLLKKQKDRPKVKNPESVIGDNKSVVSSTNPSVVDNSSTILSEDRLESKLLPERSSIQQEDD